MCTSPISRPNPYYKSKLRITNLLHDTECVNMRVPCGYCDECVSRIQLGIVERSIMEAVYNHVFMCTLTYNEDCIPRLVTSSGFEFKFADYNHLSVLFDRLRADNVFPRGFRTLSVTERGEQRGRPHFHILFFTPKYDTDTYNDCISMQEEIFPKILARWYRNDGSSRVPLKVPLCTYVRRFFGGRVHTNYDFHYVNPNHTSTGIASPAFYVTKYLLKRPDRDKRLQIALKLNLSEDEYAHTWDLIRNRFHTSRYFGLNASLQTSSLGLYRGRSWKLDDRIISYLHTCVEKSKGHFPYPCFINPYTGLYFPLTAYYRSISGILTVDDLESFQLNKTPDLEDSECFTITKMLRSEAKKDFLLGVASKDVFSEYLNV